MLERYFSKPQTVDRIRNGWLGPAIEEYVTWLSEHSYAPRCVYHRVPLLMRFGEFARRHGAVDRGALAGHVDVFIRRQARIHRSLSRSTGRQQWYVRTMRGPITQFLRVVASQTREPASTPFAQSAPGFVAHLQEERGLRVTTVEAYVAQLRSLERYLTAHHIDGPRGITPSLLDGFLAEMRTHVHARSLSTTCAALRGFLRYLFRERLVERDLSAVIDRPRSYRLSDIPRAINAEDVTRMLATVERRSSVGKRDYALLLLLVVYGLRAREVAALTLDDIDWQASVLHVRGRKAGHATTYPVATEVGEAVVDYLQHGRPHTAGRTLFFRSVAPRAAMTYRNVSDRARYYLRKAHVEVARPGSHTLRHSCAQRMVDAGFSLKVIGDVLGHRCASSTRTYAKVAVDGLRDVALGDGEGIL